MISSDSQAMGRVGAKITRTWQTAHKMKVQRGVLPEDGSRSSCPLVCVEIHDSIRRLPTVSRRKLGSIEVGKLADLVLRRRAFFGAKPALIIKGGKRQAPTG